jgi:hypothetical protein
MLNPLKEGTMPNNRTRVPIRLALLPVAVVMAVSGSAAAFASQPAAQDRPAAASVRQSDTYYEMHLTSTSATVQPGGATTTVITFDASRRLYGAPVDLSVSGLPDGVTASFSPERPPVGGFSTLTLTTTSSSAPGAFTVTIGAIINLFPSDPIGRTTPFDLTIMVS